MSEIILFLSIQDVIAIHEDTILNEGGLAGIREGGLLESAATMPQQIFEETYLHEGFAAKSAAYLYHITQNHPFYDGNKRTAAMASLIFLDVNNVTTLPSPDELEKTTLSVATGETSKNQLIDWFWKQIGI
mgnify:CR=1 FL=1